MFTLFSYSAFQAAKSVLTKSVVTYHHAEKIVRHTVSASKFILTNLNLLME